METTDRYLLMSDLFRLLSLGIAYPDKDKFEKLGKISKLIIQNKNLDITTKELLQQLISNMDYPAILNEYSRVFIKGGVPITETHITGSFNSVSDVSAFYAAFGFSPKSGETPDSIMYELEFAAILLLKIAIAPNEEAKEVTLSAYIKFLNLHLMDFSQKFSDKLQSGDAIDYYQILAKLLILTIKTESNITVTA